MNRAKRTVKRSKRTGNIGHFVYAAYSAALPERAAFVERQLSLVNSIFRKLFSDENFRTLMRAESLTAVPVYWKPLLEDARKYAQENHSAGRG
jgi:hypothetical protein